jgi:trehalose 6-phosphate phosphatase
MEVRLILPMAETTHTLNARPHKSRVSACTSAILANPDACALFLDMDGTLLELAPTPKSVRLPDGLPALLDQLGLMLGGAIAIVTGRVIAEADEILAPARFAASGVHGAEMRRVPGGAIEHVTPALDDEVAHALYRIAERYPGVIAEPKGAGLALHYRLAPHAEFELLSAIEDYLARHKGSLAIMPGKRLYEVIPSGLSKGTALAALSQLPAFRGRRPIMIGDDIGDEPAFATAEGLDGFALRVAGEHYRDDVADFAGPKAVVAWLEQLALRLSPASDSRIAVER